MDLSNLSSQEKEELLLLLHQKELLEKEAVLSTIKLHPVQEAFHKSPARIRLFCGGNGSGKSFALLHELVRTHLNKHEGRDTSSIFKSWLFIPDLKKAEDYLDLIKKICPPSQFPQTDKMGTPNLRRLLWKNGSTTTIYSFEQSREATEGTNYDALFIDEPIPRELYISSYRGLRSNPNHFVCLALTGVDEPWIFEELFLPGSNGENPNIDVFVSKTYDNRANLSEDWIVQFENSLTEDEKQVRIHGQFAVLTGRVFKEYDRRMHVVKFKPWPKDWPVWCAIDPHTRKKSVALWAGVTKDEELVVLNETEAESIQELGENIKALEARHGYRVVARKIDNSGSSQDWSGNTAVEILRKQCGLHFVPVTNEEKDVEESIFKIKHLLKPEKLMDGTEKPRLFIMENCRELAREMELYGWKDNRHPEKTGVSEKIKKVYDDHIDPLRYIVMSKPVHNWSYESISYAKGYTKAPKDSVLKYLLGK